MSQNQTSESPETHDLFSEGDYVRYKAGKGILHCGSGTYARAVVASMKPFVLISEGGDMKWSATVEASKFEKCGEAGRQELLSVMDRFKRELYPENVHVDAQIPASRDSESITD